MGNEENTVMVRENADSENQDDNSKSQRKNHQGLEHHQIGFILILTVVMFILLDETVFSENKVVEKIINDAKNVYETTEIIDKIKSFINLNYERLPALPVPDKTEEPEAKNQGGGSWFQQSEEDTYKYKFKDIMFKNYPEVAVDIIIVGFLQPMVYEQVILYQNDYLKGEFARKLTKLGIAESSLMKYQEYNQSDLKILLFQKYRQIIQNALQTQNVDEIQRILTHFQKQIVNIRKEIKEFIKDNEENTKKKIVDAHKRQRGGLYLLTSMFGKNNDELILNGKYHQLKVRKQINQILYKDLFA